MAETNYYNRKQPQQPKGFLTRNDQPQDDPVKPQQRIKAPPTTGDEPIDTGAGQQYGGTYPARGPASEIDVTQPTVTQQVSDMLSSGSLQRSPYYAQILANQQKLIALRGMPTYVNKHGKTVQGLKDDNGRLKSGLRALLERLSHMGPTPNWESFAAGVAGGAGAGIGGALVPEWDEWADRKKEIDRLEGETQNMIRTASAVSTLQTQDVQRQEVARRPQKEATAATAKIDAAATAFDRRMEYLQKQQDFTSGKAQLWTDPEDGKIYRWFPSDPTRAREPVMDPTTGEQDTDPRFKWYDIESPTTGTKIKVQGRDLFAGESQVEASKVSAENKTAESDYRWQQDDAELEGKITAAKTRVTQAQKRLSEIGGLNGLEKIKASDEAKDLRKEIRDEESDIAGWEARRKATPKPPVVKGRTGGSAILSVDEQAFVKRLVANGVTDPARQSELIKKARAEGIIK